MLKTDTVPAYARPLQVLPIPALPVPAQRLQSLDAYRGFIMLTLLAAGVFAPLKFFPKLHWLAVQTEHTEWQGCTFWDLIQPSFMFMVGVAMPFAFARRQETGQSWGRQFLHVLIRAVNLTLIGILLDHIGAAKIEIGFIRVLQQIAFGYVICFFLLGRSFLTQGIVAGVILVGYNLLWMFNRWNLPGQPWAIGNHNIGSAFDLWMLHRNYRGFYVGMNAIPSTATILFGVMAGQLLQRRLPHKQTMLILLIAGAAGVLLGLAVSHWLPPIKRIWTPSFAVLAGGLTTLMLLCFYAVIEVLGWRRWSFPLIVVGTNSIAAYVIGNAAFKGWFRGASSAWVAWVWNTRLGWPLDTPQYNMLSGLLFTCFAWVVLFWCYRRKVFFKL